MKISILLFSIFTLMGNVFAETISTSKKQMVSANNHNVLFISTAHTNTAKITLLKKVADERSNQTWNISQKSAKSLLKTANKVGDLTALFNQYDLVILDAVSVREASAAFDSYASEIAKAKTAVVAFSYLKNQALNKGLTGKDTSTLQDYWMNAGRRNLDNMLSFIAATVISKNDNSATIANVPAPIIFPQQGIYHPTLPNLIIDDLVAYKKLRPVKPQQAKIAVLLQRALIESEQTQLIDATIKQLEAKGAYVVPFFFELSPISGDYTQLLQIPSTEQATDSQAINAQDLAMKTDVDLIISFRNIHWANKRKVEFEKFGVPVMHAMTYYSGDKATWEKDMQGVSANMMSFTLVLPENAGVVDPMIVAAMNMTDQNVEIIDYQLEHLVNKAINVVNLKYKANQDKKLTMFVWGDKDVGASFMNIPESIEAISQRLANEGYQTAERDAEYFVENAKKILDPFYRDYQLTELLDNDLAELMPINKYLAWFNALPTELTQKINDHWGQPQDNFMAVEKDGEHYFILPRIRNGNMLVMRQPPRSDSKNDENMIYHQGLVPINHFYLAAYFYAREYWQSDAIVHLGTHGSQEYLGGKERGLSIYDQGNLAVWDTPVVYPFIVDDVGEAMQTKRRGRATVISHMTPPFAAAGLEGEIRNLHELMHQYKQLDQGGVKQKTASQLTKLCFDTNICKDLGWEQAQITTAFDEFIDALHIHLEDLATANQPLGLHTYGYIPEQPLTISTLVQMLGNDFTQRASEFEHENYADSLVGEHHDDDEDQGVSHSHTYHSEDPASRDKNSTDKKSEQALSPVNEDQNENDITRLSGYLTVKNYIIATDEPSTQQPVPLTELSEPLQADIERGKKLYQSMASIHELDAMVDFLNAKYIPVKSGGDPIRHPESLATGYNLFGFNPSRVPTQAAFEQGKELVEQMIANYYEKHQAYPDKMAFSLWSIETMRHYGVLESQVLYAMGVKPKWSKSGRVIGTEVIPYSELKRPRIDVVLSATGLYRDAFPNVMQMLAKAVNQVAALKEDNNSVWQNSQKVKANLLAEGVDEKEAEYLSTIRIFSNQSGDYGTGVDDAAWASDTWETDKKISDNYLGKMGYFFGADNSRWGEKGENTEGKDIQLYTKQLSGTDIAMFARSSNLFGMLSTDDPFEYFGSLSLAVRNIDGKSPDMVVANLRDAKNAKAEDAGLFLAKELRTRMFHPRWIKELQKEGYSGAVSLASKMDNFFGWQVVDPNLIRNDQWDEYLDIYVNDKLNLALDEWFKDINPAAFARMMERMLEAERKDYWQADPERLKQLVEQYIDVVNNNDLVILNDAVKAHVNELAEGYGLAPLVTKTMEAMAASADAQKAMNNQQLAEQKSENAEQQIEGQKLEKQVQQTMKPNDFIYYSLFGILFLIACGAVWQTRAAKTKHQEIYLIAPKNQVITNKAA
ncbi:cobaltochelatase subunit CobN [Cognaticolwellia mytili]|uniref:cobaltochelatase subunit CobN n=1 Tax=Cognaticolwellia mytili TaxID=1888913 RepID=UPI001301DDF7|nr:cobaltochelatase subunit CobN [Cognaticolwellia mytili]